MVVTRTELSLTDVAEEQNNRFDQKRYLAEKKFSEFVSEFDELQPLGHFTKSICNGQDFKTDFYSQIETNILYISVNQISSGILGKLYWDDITYLDVEDDKIGVEAEVDDILITRSGSYPGIAWRVTEEYLDDYRIVPSGFVQRLRLKEGIDIVPEFIAAYLNSPPVKMLTQAFACGKEQLNISQDYITSIPVPILSKERQQAVINGVTGYQTRIEQIQKLVQELKIKQGNSVIDLLTNENIEQIKLPDIPKLAVDSNSKTTQEWSLPTRRGKKESTFYVSN